MQLLPVTNFNFDKYWNLIIIPLLDDPRVIVGIDEGIRSCKAELNWSYGDSHAPAAYTYKDSWAQHMLDFWQDVLNPTLLELGIMKPDTNDKGDDDYFDNDSLYFEYKEYNDKICEPFIDHMVKTNIKAYQPFGMCHQWNPTFGLTLANVVCPNEKWKVVTSKNHSTVVNIDHSKYFDILWYDKKDKKSFGGNKIHKEVFECT